MNHTKTYYQGVSGSSIFTEWGKSHFDTKDELIEAIKKFKKDPRTHNPKMTDENVVYWKNKNYTIERITIKTEEFETI